MLFLSQLKATSGALPSLYHVKTCFCKENVVLINHGGQAYITYSILKLRCSYTILPHYFTHYFTTLHNLSTYSINKKERLTEGPKMLWRQLKRSTRNWKRVSTCIYLLKGYWYVYTWSEYDRCVLFTLLCGKVCFPVFLGLCKTRRVWTAMIVETTMHLPLHLMFLKVSMGGSMNLLDYCVV